MNSRDAVLMFCWCRDFSYNQTANLVRNKGFDTLTWTEWRKFGDESYAAMIEFYTKEQHNV